MSYEIPYSTDYTEWYGTPQNVTRLSAVLEQVVDEDGNNIGRITASWDVPDNGGTFNVLTSTDGETYTLAVVGLRNNSTVFNVEPSTDYYIKVITVLDSLQSEGTVSGLLSIDIPTPSAPVLTVLQGGISINVGIIPADYTAVINIDDGTNVTTVTVNEPVYTYMCVAGSYTVTVAYEDSAGNVGDESDPSQAVVSELATKAYVEEYVEDYVDDNVSIYNLKTPTITGYIITDDGGDYYTDTDGEVILQYSNQTFKKYNNLPAIAGVFHSGSYRTPLVVSTLADAVKIQRNDATPTESQGSFDANGITWYYSACGDSNYEWGSSYVAQNFPEVDNGTSYNSTLNAAQKLVEEADPTVSITESIEENLFYPTNMTLSSGDTITDETLKSLIAYHRPITINGTVYTPSDYTNGTYTYYALQNGTSATEIKKAQISSSWVITITTESTGGGGGGSSSFTETELFFSANGVGSGTIALSGNISDYAAIQFSLTRGGEVNISTRWITSTLLKLCVSGSYYCSFWGWQGDALHLNYTNDSTLTIANSSNLRVSRVIGLNFGSGGGGGGGSSYTAGDGIDISNNTISLETASATDIGGIKVGTNLSIDGNGVMSATDTTYTDFVGSGATASSGLVPAPPTTAGTSKYLREDGSWSVPSGGGGGGGSYTAGDGIDITNDVISLETASANDIGGIKVGSGLSIDGNGVLSATGGGGGSTVSLFAYSSPTTPPTNTNIVFTQPWSDCDLIVFRFGNANRTDCIVSKQTMEAVNGTSYAIWLTQFNGNWNSSSFVVVNSTTIRFNTSNYLLSEIVGIKN